MKITFLTFVCALFILSSCQWGTPPAKEDAIFSDTLTYELKTINKRADDCANKPDSTCTHIDMKYPVFTGQPALNDTITDKILRMFSYTNQPDSDLETYTTNFLKKYTDFKKQDPRSQMYFELENDVKVLRQDSGLVTLETNGYTFEGGAHGGSFTCYINWDTKSNKNLKISDILTDNYNPALTRIAEAEFRKQEKLSDTASLARDYFFENNKFALNQNFSVTPIGLKFVYNQYEIKPYAAGKTELLVPYAKIKTLLRPNTVVSQFVK